LNPETNSDSASLKSKGARWVSAKVQIIQTGRIGKRKTEDKNSNDLNLNDPTIKIIITKTVLKTDS
jgi:hypothetical protein